MSNLKPSQNMDIQKMSTDIWGIWKKYLHLNNASPNKKDHFTEEIWKQIVTDINEFGKRWNESQFAIHIAMCYLNELEARDRGSYPDPYNRDF